MKVFGLLLILAFIEGFGAKNVNISCVFNNFDTCYSKVKSLGVNFTTRFAENGSILSGTCTQKQSAITCLKEIDKNCNADLKTSFTKITKLMNDTCDLNTNTSKLFLNASTCFNRNIATNLVCEHNFTVKNPKNETDLCCVNFNLIKCLKFVSFKTCNKTVTSLGNELLDTYREYHNTICAKYKSICSDASRLTATAFSILGIFYFLFFRVCQDMVD